MGGGTTTFNLGGKVAFEEDTVKDSLTQHLTPIVLMVCCTSLARDGESNQNSPLKQASGTPSSYKQVTMATGLKPFSCWAKEVNRGRAVLKLLSGSLCVRVWS